MELQLAPRLSIEINAKKAWLSNNKKGGGGAGGAGAGLGVGGKKKGGGGDKGAEGQHRQCAINKQHQKHKQATKRGVYPEGGRGGGLPLTATQLVFIALSANSPAWPRDWA